MRAIDTESSECLCLRLVLAGFQGSYAETIKARWLVSQFTQLVMTLNLTVPLTDVRLN